MSKKINPMIAFAIIFAILSLALQLINFQLKISFPLPVLPEQIIKVSQIGIEKFQSEQEFKNYLANARLSYFAGFGRGGGREMMLETAPLAAPKADLGEMPERFSETTVQVAGIDEPDILKTDGREIYYSPEQWLYYREVMPLTGKLMPRQPENNLKAIKAFPPADLTIDSKIEKNGQLLLNNNILVIFSYDKIYGYDVTDPKNPQEKWTVEYKNNSSLVSARLFQNKIYFITQTGINYSRPCPFEPLAIDNQPFSINCVDIYYPTVNSQPEVTYNALVLEPQTGAISKTVTFVGSYQSVVYMSKNAIYITYSYFGDFVKYQYNFFLQNQDLIESWVIEKLAKLQTYDLSDQAKMSEIQYILSKFYNSLTEDERLRIQNELSNRMQAYSKEHQRELELTGIVKINISDLQLKASGSIPGTPLNQFSLDEYNNNLRIATTVGDNWWGIDFINARNQSTNDLYVLDANLNIIGKILDLGLEEQIYSARFIEDKGYLVTFKRIDPFYVLDLSNPNNPQKVGELKIPGFSSYLHPITADKILGVGEEDNKVKISLFDVFNPANPIELAKYNLDEYYTEVQNTHHAFLLDTKHNIFFLPGGKGGYIFSYVNNELKLVKAISDIRAKRAVYINDYLYIVGDDKIVVLNEADWEKVKEIELD